jgi:ABC-type glycerol-3-phosphate transport system permease component
VFSSSRFIDASHMAAVLTSRLVTPTPAVTTSLSLSNPTMDISWGTRMFSLCSFVMTIPGAAMQVTVYKIMHSLGLINSLPCYIILMLGTDVISIYIFLQFYAAPGSSRLKTARNMNFVRNSRFLGDFLNNQPGY